MSYQFNLIFIKLYLCFCYFSFLSFTLYCYRMSHCSRSHSLLLFLLENPSKKLTLIFISIFPFLISFPLVYISRNAWGNHLRLNALLKNGEEAIKWTIAYQWWHESDQTETSSKDWTWLLNLPTFTFCCNESFSFQPESFLCSEEFESNSSLKELLHPLIFINIWSLVIDGNKVNLWCFFLLSLFLIRFSSFSCHPKKNIHKIYDVEDISTWILRSVPQLFYVRVSSSRVESIIFTLGRRWSEEKKEEIFVFADCNLCNCRRRKNFP